MNRSLAGIGIIFFAILMLISRINFNDNITLQDEVISESLLPELPFEIKRPNAIVYEEGTIDDELYTIYLTVYDSKPIESVTIGDINEYDYSVVDESLINKDDPFAYTYVSDIPLEDVTSPNSTVEIRGQSARLADQKSYKIKMYDNLSWEGYRIINLNKHFEDDTRFKNKLSFDLFKRIDHLSSMETKFVRLYVKDLSQPNPVYEHYGLFTFIEQPNEDFIDKIYNDRSGSLYKAEFFEFYNYEVIKTIDDPTYDAFEFEKILEIRGANEHYKLKRMLTDLNNYNVDILDIVDMYFDEENMLAWLSVNILLNNYDTSSRNFMLYNPTHTNKWYFLPWDYDKAWTDRKRASVWQRGISNYWGMVLFNRYFKKEGSFEKFEVIFNETYEKLKRDELEDIINRYYGNTLDVTLTSPDIDFLELTGDEYKELVDYLSQIPSIQYDYYYEHIDTPMPFYLGKPVVDDEITFTWEAAYDLQNDPLSYHLIVSRDSEFTDLILDVEDIFLTSYTIPKLPDGTYYFKVLAKDDKGNEQVSFDYTVTEDGLYVFGAEVLEVGDDDE